MGASQGRLVICATPIGNLGDVTERVLDVLRACDAVCAEDTRVTGKLLAAYGISKRLERLDEARIGSCAQRIVDRVAAGETIAYCTDAGMPGVSDPGMRLLACARASGAKVEVAPGASAASCAYVVSGTMSPHYYFGGFLPRKAADRTSLLESLRTLDAALVFYESPQRVAASLESIACVYPLREVAVCRELTKLHEEVVRDLAPRVRDEFRTRSETSSVKGEIVIVIDGPCAEEEQADAASAAAAARRAAVRLCEEGMGAKDIAARLVDEFGIARNDAYDIALRAGSVEDGSL